MNLTPRQTVEIVAAQRGKAEAIRYADQPIVARNLQLDIEVSHSAGAVTSHALHCLLSEDERRVLDLQL